MYENILFPVDDSEDSSEILHHVGELANWADATIHLLFVADTTRDSVTVVENTVVDALVQEGEGIVEDASKTLSTLGVEYETDVVQGNPAPTIVEYADRYGHDLIAMSTHGRRGVSRYLQGSVSEKVVRLSSVPVLTARMQPDEQLVFPTKMCSSQRMAVLVQPGQRNMAWRSRSRLGRPSTSSLSLTTRRSVSISGQLSLDKSTNRQQRKPPRRSSKMRRHMALLIRYNISNREIQRM